MKYLILLLLASSPIAACQKCQDEFTACVELVRETKTLCDCNDSLDVYMYYYWVGYELGINQVRAVVEQNHP